MKIFIALLLLGAAALASDISVQTANTFRTNAETGAIYSIKRDIFTKDGQTNLVRESEMVGRVVERRTHHFFHNGRLVGSHYIDYKYSHSNFATQEASPYCFVVGLNADEKIRDVVIISNGYEVETFVYTNGIFLPDNN